jgi:hypothetical protein
VVRLRSGNRIFTPYYEIGLSGLQDFVTFFAMDSKTPGHGIRISESEEVSPEVVLDFSADVSVDEKGNQALPKTNPFVSEGLSISESANE